MNPGIVVVGSLNMDLVISAPRLPKVGETILGGRFDTFPGGKGANQAVAAARMGGRVCMVGRVGDDDFGSALLNTIQADGIDAGHVRHDPQAATGVALITVDRDGQNTIVVAPGANGQVGPEDVLAAEEAFRQAGVLLVQLECPLPAVEAAIDLANRHGLKTVLNPAPAQQLSPDLLQKVDTLAPNQTELALLTGTEDLDQGVETLQRWGLKNIIVTLGGEGVLVAAGDEQRLLPAYPVQVVDTVAAGDAFMGAYAVALTEGLDPFAAAAWGNAAGALSVTRPGAQPSLPHRREVLDLLQRER